MEHLLKRVRFNHTLLSHALLVIWGSCLLTAAAPLTIRLPVSPVPITFQVTLVVLLGVMLGPKRGVAAVALWLGEGALGLPVFANGSGGIWVFLGPTGGYLLGYPIIALIAALIAYRRPTGLRLGLAFLIGSLSVYPTGLFQLSRFVGWNQAIALGFLPFLIGDFLKSLFLAITWKKVAHKFIPNGDC